MLIISVLYKKNKIKIIDVTSTNLSSTDKNAEIVSVDTMIGVRIPSLHFVCVSFQWLAKNYLHMWLFFYNIVCFICFFFIRKNSLLDNWLSGVYYRPRTSIIHWSNKIIFSYKRERGRSTLRVSKIIIFSTMSVPN
jgi:hypothetical protein